MNRTLAALVIAALLPLPARALDVALGRLTFTIAKGTSSCGGPALGPPPLPPFSGEVDNPDGTKRADLGLGCLTSAAVAPRSSRARRSRMAADRSSA